MSLSIEVFIHTNTSVDNVLEQEFIQEYKTCTCVVCFDKIVQIKFLPCNHKICCNECSVRLIRF